MAEAENTPDDAQTTINDPKSIIDELILVFDDAFRTIIDPISIIDYKNRFINCAKGIIDDAIWIIGSALRSIEMDWDSPTTKNAVDEPETIYHKLAESK